MRAPHPRRASKASRAAAVARVGVHLGRELHPDEHSVFVLHADRGVRARRAGIGHGASAEQRLGVAARRAGRDREQAVVPPERPRRARRRRRSDEREHRGIASAARIARRGPRARGSSGSPRRAPSALVGPGLALAVAVAAAATVAARAVASAHRCGPRTQVVARAYGKPCCGRPSRAPLPFARSSAAGALRPGARTDVERRRSGGRSERRSGRMTREVR